MGDVEAALAVCRRALARDGDAAETHAAVGEILSMNHETMAEAAESFRQALRGAPRAAHLHASLGDALCQLGQLKVAAEHYVQALQAKPDDPAVLNRMASLNLRRGQAEEAAFCCLRALDLAPGFHDAHRNFILALQAEPRTDPLLLMDHAKKWGQRFADVPRFVDVPRLGERSSADSMRIGYLAGDLNRPFRRDLLERMVCHHKALGTEVHVYADQVSGGSPSAGRLRDACQRIAHLDDLSLAERIRDDGIHVLIDLCGQGDDHRAGVLARKPAPVQVGWLGHCGSTGLSAVDHVLADAEVLPPALADGCVETVTFLPVGYAFFPVPDRAIEPGTVPARSNGYPTFGCLGTVSQLNPEVVRIWGGLLRGLPGSRLRLCMLGLEDASVRETVAKQFEAAEVSSDRLKLGGWKTSDERLEACREMDLVLDPYPVNGGLHVLEAIWMGLPVVGLQGGTFAGRTTRSFLKTLDLEDFVVDSREAFVETATSLASDLPQLEQLRRDLRPRLLESPLCDDRGFVIHLENACRRMCREASEEPGQPT
jgi:predicted O-linked N-acetylglucosamine transferase (SPINDLY family)